jgi:type II secretory pathway pseudopilin PulG
MMHDARDTVTWGSRRSRGQAGITLIELIVVISISTIVLMPLFLLVNHTLSRQEPTRDANQAAAAQRVIRAQLKADWVLGQVIRVNLPALNGTAGEARADCHGGAHPYSAAGVTGGVIAIHTTVRRSGQSYDQRIVYSLRDNPDGGFDLIRRECLHSPQVIAGDDYWADFSSAAFSVTGTTGSEKVLARGIGELRLPTASSCNNNYATDPPYSPCDVNVTVMGLDGSSSTIRLYQQAGRTS